MRYSDVLKSVELILLGNDVPLIVGESGIGKTSLVRDLCSKKGYYLVNIDANLLKEGEIGGLPVVVNNKTIYATHHKLKEIEENIDNNNNGVLLFIDELNRCEHTVQQELMNLIINREINGYRLSKEVKIIGAMNPSNKYSDSYDSDYQVVDMDPAQEDRFVWINMESDVKEWIKWAMGKGKVCEEIIEFISTFPEYLHMTKSNDDIKATPRSWQRVNKTYINYKNNKESFTENILFNVVRGNVGTSIATDFINFIKNRKETIATPDIILSYNYLPFELREILANESHSRLYILAKGCLNKLSEECKQENIDVISQLLTIYPKDLRLGIMKEIKLDIPESIYRKFLNSESFMEAFFDIYC